MILFTVSIAVHDRADLTRQCLDSVFACSPKDQVEVIVFDNASSMETASLLRKWSGPRFGVLRSEENLGFGAAHNKTLAYAKGIYFVVLNNDVVVQPEWLEKMRAVMLRHSRMGIVGPKSSACRLGADGVGSSIGQPDYVEGSCMMIPTWLARREGLFDPLFEFAYCEDADLSLRLREKGWDIGFTDQALHHHRAATSQLVRSRGLVDLDGYHRQNHARLRGKWARYLQTHRFENSVVIRRGAARGDVLMVTPIIRAIRERNIHTRIYVETSTPEVLVGNPNIVPSMRHLEQPIRKYDLDWSYEKSPKTHIVEAYAKVCFLPRDIDKSTDVYYAESDRLAAKAVMAYRRFATIHPGVTAWSGRNWGTAKFSEFSTRLVGRGYEVVVVGDKHTPRISGETVDLRGASVGMTAAFAHRSGLFVGIDSFPMHIAQALRIPTVGIFGAIDPKLRLNGMPFIRGVTVPGLECLGCHHEISRPVNESQCKRDRVYCMEDLTVDMVLGEVDEALRIYSMDLETSKIRDRVIEYCKGKGIDIGCSSDKITPGALGFDKKMGPDVDVVGDASMRMPFEDGEFDYVFSSHALEDIADTPATLQEWTRILRSGGHIIIQVPHPEHYKGFNADHVHPGWSPEGLCELLTDAGCTVVESFADVGENRYSSVVVARK